MKADFDEMKKRPTTAPSPIHLSLKSTIGFVGPTCGSYRFNSGFEKNMHGDG